MNRRLLSGAVYATNRHLTTPAKMTGWLLQQRKLVRSSFDDRPGDPVDRTGQSLRYAIAVAGLIEEFGSLKEGLAALGMATLQEFYAAVGDPNFSRLGENDNGVLCYRPAAPRLVIPAQRTTAPSTTWEQAKPVIELDTFDELGF